MGKRHTDSDHKVFILEADPTRYGGIQQFVRNLTEYLPPERTFLLAYYGGLAEEKPVSVPLIRLNGGGRNEKRKKRIYLSGSPLRRNFALLCDLFRIRRNLADVLKNGDVLIVNSASSLLLFCCKTVLRNCRIVLVQHTAPRMMYRRPFDFGGLLRPLKIAFFRKFVDAFVMLSPREKDEFSRWLPLEGKLCRVIRHSVRFPESLPGCFPQAAAVLARLVPLKRIDRVIDCARLLPEVRFNIYGDGPEERRLKTLAAPLTNVCFHGKTDDIDGVFRDNSMLLVTSEYEGYSFAGIEACAHGRPVVVLNTYPAAKDLVEDHVSGIVLDAFSSEALAGAIKEILASPQSFRDGTLKHRELYSFEKIRMDWRTLISLLESHSFGN